MNSVVVDENKSDYQAWEYLICTTLVWLKFTECSKIFLTFVSWLFISEKKKTFHLCSDPVAGPPFCSIKSTLCQWSLNTGMWFPTGYEQTQLVKLHSSVVQAADTQPFGCGAVAVRKTWHVVNCSEGTWSCNKDKAGRHPRVRGACSDRPTFTLQLSIRYWAMDLTRASKKYQEYCRADKHQSKSIRITHMSVIITPWTEQSQNMTPSAACYWWGSQWKV